MRRIALARSLPLAVGLVVAGCYTPERASREALVVPAPESWVARAAEAESAQGVQGDWWLRFQSQDLNAAVEHTLQNNLDLRAAEARLAAAASLARIAGAASRASAARRSRLF